MQSAQASIVDWYIADPVRNVQRYMVMPLILAEKIGPLGPVHKEKPIKARPAYYIDINNEGKTFHQSFLENEDSVRSNTKP